ncbi:MULTISPECIES: hypothetical protein [Bacillus cereus group]|uniref:hypothetical protein n=1 Tax=Bacillus cereus group TaxID=86661 RepID=UPI0002385B2A|nr:MULTISPECIES: hypothetical protein [Bacillus cereus group]ANT40269.1 hypothetical protein [Bacillus phage PfNC7401]ANT40339.1 hypothetical protein [Bacillus phage PfIS075]EJP82558.1 hypothetical protein IAU_05774 [Bacillus cereus IS075]EOO82178.1 hypothetical protein IGS_05941 [Bacillus cereus IS845/00]EOO95298.1 hypothetical protein IGQ_04057 [Bacillus cereus IS195]BAL21532.1 conserved hypothetical protein [Bacillus cereus NC7401]
MKKILSLITSVALAGGFLFAPADNKDQPKQIAKDDSKAVLYMEVGPGGGMG